MHPEIELALKNAKEDILVTQDLIRLHTLDYIAKYDHKSYEERLLIAKIMKEFISDKKFINLITKFNRSEEFIESYKN